MKIIIFLFLSSMSLCACYSPRYVYSPATQNIPLLNKKNDLELSAFYAGSIDAFEKKGNYNRGIDLQTAWAISNHFAVILNESARWEKNGGNDSFFPNDSSFLSYKRNFTEIGLGYFSPAKNNKKMQFQVFGGAASGSSKIYDDFTSNSTHVNKYHYSRVTKIFIQPAIMYSLFKNFSTALSSRFTEVIFSHIRTNYTPTELDNYILDSIAVSPVFFWEPAVSYTFGFKKFPVKFQIQGSITVLLNHRFVEHRNANIGIGLTCDFPKKTRRKPAASND
ncbi:MAG: hypothetical protein ABI863_06255 [Ginsengibacter sp.]